MSSGSADARFLARANASSGLTMRLVRPGNFLPTLLGFPSVQRSGSRPYPRQTDAG